jgi:hypothetical protein
MRAAVGLEKSKPVLRPILVASLFMGMSALCARPVNQNDVIVMTLRLANYEDAPVQLVGLRHADDPTNDPASDPHVHLRNTSSLKTARIWLQAVVSATDQGGKELGRTNSNTPNNDYPSERMIEPGADVWAHETALRSDTIVSFDKDAHARCLLATITLLSVEFEDGTRWMAGVLGAGKTLTYSGQLTKQENTCKRSAPSDSPGLDPSLPLYSGVRRFPEPEKLVNWVEEKGYSFSCPLRRAEKYYAAACPF